MQQYRRSLPIGRRGGIIRCYLTHWGEEQEARKTSSEEGGPLQLFETMHYATETQEKPSREATSTRVEETPPVETLSAVR